MTMWPNTALEPTPVTPGSFRCGFPVGGNPRRRGSAFGRWANKMTLTEIRGGVSRQSLRKLQAADYTFLWIGDFWDGPVSGMLKLDGANCWFEQFEESEEEGSPWYRRYAVVRLSAEQIALEKEVHADFQRFVGRHMDCDANSEDKGLRPQKEWSGFYDKHGAYCRERRFEECEVIAWFEK